MYKTLRKSFFERLVDKLFLFDWIFFSLIILLICVGLLTIHTIDSANTNYLFKHSLRITFSIFLFKN